MKKNTEYWKQTEHKFARPTTVPNRKKKNQIQPERNKNEEQ